MTDRADLVPLIEAFGTARVLTVGDVILDRFATGTVERISPEAPIPVLQVTGESTMAGGAGNVIRNLGAMGCGGRFVGVIGDDPAAWEVSRLLADYSDIEMNLITDESRRTSIKTRFVAAAQQIMRADYEDVRDIDGAVRDAVLEGISLGIEDCDVVVLSDYGKGVLSAEVTAAIIEAANEAGRTVIVDPKGTDYSRYRGAGFLTPNRQELAQATNMPTGTDGEIATAAGEIISRVGAEAVLVTRSAEGMTLVRKSGDVHHLPTEAREVFDVSGAGDTVAATLAGALAVGADPVAATELANVAAGIVVGKVGTAAAHNSDIVAALHHQDLSSAEAKVAALAPALDRIAVWRRQGLRVGFTNGCFDLLHPGHVALLGKAREACDRLVVGLNTDASVKRLKGPERPIQAEMARATVLASLASVDMVVFFAEDTPKELIEAVRPDLLVKGADYAIDQVVGADFVQANGGQVLLVELEPDHSTSAAIARMNGNPASSG